SVPVSRAQLQAHRRTAHHQQRRSSAARADSPCAPCGRALCAGGVDRARADRRRSGAGRCAPVQILMLARRMLLDTATCHAIARDVLAQRASWVRRSEAEFYTLGAASYLDLGAEYDARAAALNPLLRGRFAPLYDHLAAQLAVLLEEPVVYAPGKALP